MNLVQGFSPIYADDVIPVVGNTTLNPLDKSPLIVLSGGNLTAGVANNGGMADHSIVRSILHKSSGKYHAELLVNNLTRNVGFGLASSAKNLTDGSYLGSDNESLGWFDDGFVGFAGATVATTPTFGNGDLLGLDLDASTKKAWRWLNGTALDGDPTVPSGGIDLSAHMTDFYCAIDMQLQGDSSTVNFGATSFTHPTTGFGGWI